MSTEPSARPIFWGFLFVALLLLILSGGCVTRGEIRAAIWLNNGLPKDLCGPSKVQSPHPELWDRGFYRRLNTGKFEFISFCNPKSVDWSSINKKDLEELMNQALPKNRR